MEMRIGGGLHVINCRGLFESTRIRSTVGKLYVPVTVHREQGVKKEYQQHATI